MHPDAYPVSTTKHPQNSPKTPLARNFWGHPNLSRNHSMERAVTNLAPRLVRHIGTAVRSVLNSGIIIVEGACDFRR